MVGRVFLGILLSGAIAGSALAQSDGGDYEFLSTGNQRIVDALYTAQDPIQGTPRLTRDDIASLHSEDGWGVVFKDLKVGGYYPDAKNLGQVVSAARRHGGTQGTTATGDGGGGLDIGSGVGRGHGALDRASETTRRAATRSRPNHARRTTTRNAVRHQRIHHVQRVHRSGTRGGHGKK